MIYYRKQKECITKRKGATVVQNRLFGIMDWDRLDKEVAITEHRVDQLADYPPRLQKVYYELNGGGSAEGWE